MLTITLFAMVFVSVVWLSCSFQFVITSLSGMSFFDAGILNVILYTLFVSLPVLVLWFVFSVIAQYAYNKSSSRQMYKLFSQMKKNQEYSDLLARIMLETEQNVKSSFLLSKFDILISDMNELLSEFLIRERLVTSEQIESLWVKVQNGGKWSFGKVLIENYNRQPMFQKKIFADASVDSLLAGTIMEFCSRYQTLLSMLEKHDKEKIFLTVVETGVLGKVFAIMAPVAGELRRSKDVFEDMPPQSNNIEAPAEFEKKEINKTGFLSKILPVGKEDKIVKEEKDENKDAFSLALERSFGSEDVEIRNEPTFDTEKNSYEDKKEMRETVEENNTDKALNALKKEWQDIKIKPDDKEEDLTYPFGGWTDAENYKK